MRKIVINTLFARILIFSVILLASYNFSFADEEGTPIKKDFFNREKISGDWGGIRTSLEDKGISFSVVYKGELWTTAYGDVDHNSSYCDNFDVLFNADFEKVMGWNGANLFFHGLGNEGSDPNYYTGVKQGISNIAVVQNTWKVFELYLEQKLFDNRLALLFGLLDLNSNFDSKVVSMLFLNPSHGIGVDWAQTGKNGPSIFPTASLAFRIRVAPFENTYLQAGIFNGLSGNTNNLHGTQILINKDNGWLITAKAGYSKGNKCDFLPGNEKCKEMPYSKFAFGFWYYTDSYNHITSGITNWGVYSLFEQDIYNEPGDIAQGLALNARFGVADDIINKMNYFFSSTLVYTGLIPTRETDQIGLAIATGHNSYLNRLEKFNNGQIVDAFEHDIEFTYKFFLTPAIAFQPDVQYILSPSLLEKKTNVLVVGARLLLVF